MSDRCVQDHTPAVVAASVIMSSEVNAKDEVYKTAVMRCPEVESLAESQPREAFDRMLLCRIMCCCRKHPASAVSGKSELRQQCMHQVLTTADRMLGYRSRYKSEISYDMISGPEPKPLMHRNDFGEDTTQPSTYWQARTKDIEGYEPGQGHVRRPDVGIVNDVARPPTPDNLELVIEVKFEGDKPDRQQLQDYAKIAGNQNKAVLLEEWECNCREETPDESPHDLWDPYILPVFRRQNEIERRHEIDWGEVGQALAFGVSTIVAGIATVALFLSPFEGPAGELAAGALTTSAATAATLSFKRIFQNPSNLKGGS